VSDDGNGFLVARSVDGAVRPLTGPDPDGALPPGLSGGIGLAAMRERAELVGADLDIRSRPGEGTTVRVSVSLSAHEGVDE
jgi:signal transduction histidine kinase